MIKKSLYLYKNVLILFALLWCYSKNTSLLSMSVKTLNLTVEYVFQLEAYI